MFHFLFSISIPLPLPARTLTDLPYDPTDSEREQMGSGLSASVILVSGGGAARVRSSVILDERRSARREKSRELQQAKLAEAHKCEFCEFPECSAKSDIALIDPRGSRTV